MNEEYNCPPIAWQRQAAELQAREDLERESKSKKTMKPTNNLPRPYKYELSIAQAKKLVKDLKAICEPYKKKARYASIDTKAITKGYRLSIFILATEPELKPAWVNYEGMNENEWNELNHKLMARLTGALETNYIPELQTEPWTVQSNFHTVGSLYIKYKEL